MQEKTRFTLTSNGRDEVERYIRELKAKQTEILDANKDTCDDTNLPTMEDIVSDIEFIGVEWDDPDGPCYYNSWGVTDHYDSDTPIGLYYGKDFIESDDTFTDEERNKALEFLLKQYGEDGYDEADALADLFEKGYSLKDFRYDETRYAWAKRIVEENGLVNEPRFVDLMFDGGEFIATIQVEEETDEEIKGRIVYTISAYGSAVVTDALETGRKVVYNKKKDNITDIIPTTSPKSADIQEGICIRENMKKLFISSQEQVVQIIDVSEIIGNPLSNSDSEVHFVFKSTLPKTEDVEGVPMMVEGCYYAGDHTSRNNVIEALNSRDRYVSTSGKFLPETKVMIGGNVVCTLGDYNDSKLQFTPENNRVADLVLRTIKETELAS